MDPWRLLNGTNLASKAYLADMVTQVNDKTSDVYSDKPAAMWMREYFEAHFDKEPVCGLAHGNRVCYCPVCLVDIAKADTFVAANIGRRTRKRILRCTENEKFDILAEYFIVSMCSDEPCLTETRPDNVSMVLSTLCPKEVGVSAQKKRKRKRKWKTRVCTQHSYIW